MKADTIDRYYLKGSTDSSNADRKVAFLTTVLERAETKGIEIAQLRQRNLNFSLIIIAGVLTFSAQFAPDSKWYSLWVAGALAVIMVFFSLLDRRFHRYIHGWRGTKIKLVDTIASVINNPDQDITVLLYDQEAENTAEPVGLQPCITYALAVAAVVHFAYLLWSAVK